MSDPIEPDIATHAYPEARATAFVRRFPAPFVTVLAPIDGNYNAEWARAEGARIMGEPDYSAILGVDRFASAEYLKQAYRELAKRFHPDLNSGTTPLGTTFRGIARAYAVLSDPVRRAAYDATLPPLTTRLWARDPAPPPPTPAEFRREYTGRRTGDPPPPPPVSKEFRHEYSGPWVQRPHRGRSLKMFALGTGILVFVLGVPAFVSGFEQDYHGGVCSFHHKQHSLVPACNERIEDHADTRDEGWFRGAP